MNDRSGGTGLRRHNVLATFPDEGSADDAVRELRDRAIPPDHVIVTTKGEEPTVPSGEMRDELEGMVAGAGLGAAMTKSQAQGAADGRTNGQEQGRRRRPGASSVQRSAR